MHFLFIDSYTSYVLTWTHLKQAGFLLGKTELNRIDFLYKLTNAKAKMDTQGHAHTRRNQRTIFSFYCNTTLNSRQHKTSQPTIVTYTDYPEAGIYADTYHVPYGINEKNLIAFLTYVSFK